MKESEELKKQYDDIRKSLNSLYETYKEQDRRYSGIYEDEDIREYMRTAKMDSDERRATIKNMIQSKMKTAISYLRLGQYALIGTLIGGIVGLSIMKDIGSATLTMTSVLLLSIIGIIVLQASIVCLKSEVELILLDACILSQRVQYHHMGNSHLMVHTRYLIACIKSLFAHVGTEVMEDYAKNKLKTHNYDSFVCTRDTIDAYNSAVMKIDEIDKSIFPEENM